MTWWEELVMCMMHSRHNKQCNTRSEFVVKGGGYESIHFCFLLVSSVLALKQHGLDRKVSLFVWEMSGRCSAWWSRPVLLSYGGEFRVAGQE